MKRAKKKPATWRAARKPDAILPTALGPLAIWLWREPEGDRLVFDLYHRSYGPWLLTVEAIVAPEEPMGLPPYARREVERQLALLHERYKAARGAA